MKGWTLIILLAGVLASCGGTETKRSPLDQLKLEFKTKPAYTILLQDMDLKGEKLKHKYTIIQFKKDKSYTIEQSKWYTVDEDFFRLHEADLGMEVLSRLSNGYYNSLPTPPGFSQIIGDSLYGFWNPTIASIDTTDIGIDTFYYDVGQSEWKFHDAHQSLAKALEIETMEIRFNEWNQYKIGYYMNRPFYGTEQLDADSTHYGTHSRHWYYHRPYFYNRRRQKDNFYTSNMRSRSTTTRGGGGFGK